MMIRIWGPGNEVHSKTDGSINNKGVGVLDRKKKLHTLELDVGGKWRKFCRPECSLMGDMSIR